MKESEEVFKSIVDAANDAIILVNDEGNIVYWNTKAEQIFGYSAKEATLKNLHDLIIPQKYHDKFKKGFPLFKINRQGAAIGKRLEVMVLKRNGEEFPVELTLSSLKLEDKWHAIAIVRDISERKNLEGKYTLLAHALASIRECVSITDMKDNILFVNPAFLKTYGYEEHELIGKPITLVRSSNNQPSIVKKILSTTIDGEWHGEIMNRRKDGSEFPVSLSTSRVCDENANVIALIGVSVDITERRREEEKLRILSRTVEQSPASVIITDTNGDIEYVNPAFTETTGYTFEEVKGQNPRILKSGKTSQANYKAMWNILRAGGEWLGEFQNKKKNGELFWEKVFISSIKDLHGKITHFVAVKEDITAHKEVEALFHFMNVKNEQILSTLPAALIEINEQDVIIRWNISAKRIFGFDKEKIVGKGLTDSGIQWEWNKINRGIADCRKEGLPIQLDDIKCTHKNGTQVFLSVSITPVLSDLQNKSNLLILAKDVTNYKVMESQLAQAQKLESIGQLAAGIAHEINTPIQYVGDSIYFLQDGFSDLIDYIKMSKELLQANKTEALNLPLVQKMEDIAEDIELDYLIGSIPEALGRSKNGVQRVTEIVRAMKKFSHPGKEEFTLTDINEELKNTITVSKNEWKYVADIVTEFDPSLPMVACLPGELNQVFLNIIVNAAHAIKDRIGENSTEKGKITINTTHDENYIEIRIKDTGSGIPDTIKSKVFDPFFTTKEVGKGTGQGLAISYNVVVEKHKGCIDLETELGVGTTFIIRLPLNQKVKKPLIKELEYGE